VEVVMFGHHQHVYPVTSAAESHSDDLNRRRRNYLISMLLRVVLFPSALLFHGPLRWAMLLFALIMPTIAVIIANNSGPRQDGDDPESPDHSAVSRRDDR
jgi:hypothetical protein